MYLHDDKEIFKEIIEQVAAETGRTEIIIEKDYYVTMLLQISCQMWYLKVVHHFQKAIKL